MKIEWGSGCFAMQTGEEWRKPVLAGNSIAAPRFHRTAHFTNFKEIWKALATGGVRDTGQCYGLIVL